MDITNSENQSGQNEREEKQRYWDIMATHVEYGPGPGNEVELGIKETVIALSALGFNTIQSCEGHLERAKGAPWVMFEVIETEKLIRRLKTKFNIFHHKDDALRLEAKKLLFESARKVMDLINEFYANRHVSAYRRIIITGCGNSNFGIESSGAFLQEIAEGEEKRIKLQEYQEEMRAFTEFLKRKYFRII